MDSYRQYLPRAYKIRFANIADYRIAVWRRIIDGYLCRYIEPQASVLDLGSGWGEFINQIHCSKKYAMDLNSDSERHLEIGTTFFGQDCAKAWPLPESSLDLVFTSNLLEHLPSKESIQETLQQALRCLKNGGRLICIGPNIRFAAGKYWDFWDHHIPITERSLSEILEILGFEIELCLPKFIPYSIPKRLPPPPWTVTLYLKVPFFWRFLGGQFLVVARRKPE